MARRGGEGEENGHTILVFTFPRMNGILSPDGKNYKDTD